MARPPQPDDLYRFQIPMDPRLSPDGRLVTFTVQSSSAKRDGYRHAVWVAAVEDGTGARASAGAASTSRRLTYGGPPPCQSRG